MADLTGSKKLSFKALLSIAIGYVIGSGVVTITGAAIGQTGQSTWIAYGGAVILGFILILPFIILGTALRLHGGDYTLVLTMLGPKMAGIFIMNFIVMNLAISLTAVAMGIYVQSLFPGANAAVVSIITLTFFFGINLLGLKAMSGLQNIMSVLLIAGLATFCIMGCTELSADAFALSAPGYFLNGSKGFVSAVVMLVFSTTLHQTLLNFGADAQDARRDIPKAIIATTGIIFIVYVSIGLVASNVLPVEQVANQPLTYVARKILPTPLFVFFMIGGPIGAICTTLNAIFSAASKPLLQGARDGWFPPVFAKLNRFGAPVAVMGCLYLVALIPIALGYDVSMITNNTVLVQYIVKFILLTAIWQLPKKYPREWKESWLHLPDWLFYLIMVIAFCAQAFMVIVSAGNLTPAIVGISVAVIAAMGTIALFRYKSGRVHAVVREEDLI